MTQVLYTKSHKELSHIYTHTQSQERTHIPTLGIIQILSYTLIHLNVNEAECLSLAPVFVNNGVFSGVQNKRLKQQSLKCS